MSQPCLQLIATRGAAAPFGTAPFGTAPFGGQRWAPVTMPRVALGSGNLTRLLDRRVSDVVHTRRGQPVSVRPAANWGLWEVRLPLVLEADLDALWVFCAARVFRLLPTGDPATYFTVYWQSGDFRPTPLGNGKYSLTFTLEEVAN